MMSEDFNASSKKIRELIVDRAMLCGEACHIGGSLSMVDILSVLFGGIIDCESVAAMSEDRDIFILSKGHCVLGYYAAMNSFGLMSDEVFASFQQDGSDLIAHPVKNLKLGIESSNGSLGQGLSYGTGIALGMKLRGQDRRRVFVVLGDGECNEGSIWETAASAAEFKVNNITAILDVNGCRNDGANATYPGVERFRQIWSAFGWNVACVDGHDHAALFDAFKGAKSEESRPTVILASTVKGKGVSFMENNNDWHHNRITKKTYDSIKEEWATL
jgi:transketolase